MPDILPPVLTTARLRLRPFTHNDTAALFRVFSDAEVVRFWSTGAWTELAQAEQMIEEAMLAYREGGLSRYAIALAATDELIGICNLRGFFAQNRRCELGYALGSAHWGYGYAFEALDALLGYAFINLDMNRIEADIDPRNTASARLLERLGFRYEGTMPERWFVHGEFADTAYYGLLRRYRDERVLSRSSPGATG
ncbi:MULTISPECIES: GNAT family N-acetyltransferase [unclassified Massilia]|uniref:GNAT family N-acetyltransferase n=1 Tax=unclassified Massilia TaxID=2609279 RepID=UPI001785DA6B|nr:MULTISPECIES: GNAT family N-acetyltransferase [unclassified Massilia]MBD8529098.1 GNAT family N-acetyltransferase [Massilia sp. CFBP 13647]MBD8672492.1 GNAT family N-acetyltransferase [Massilia sp. CFBP 13721]